MAPAKDLDSVITDHPGVGYGWYAVMHRARIDADIADRRVDHVHHPVRERRLHQVAPMPQSIPLDVAEWIEQRALHPENAITHVTHDQADPMGTRHRILLPQFGRKLEN